MRFCKCPSIAPLLVVGKGEGEGEGAGVSALFRTLGDEISFGICHSLTLQQCGLGLVAAYVRVQLTSWHKWPLQQTGCR